MPVIVVQAKIDCQLPSLIMCCAWPTLPSDKAPLFWRRIKPHHRPYMQENQVLLADGLILEILHFRPTNLIASTRNE